MHPSLGVQDAGDEEPCYVISVAARLVGVHAQTLRYYERIGLMDPARSRGNIRMYSPNDVRRAQWIKSLIEDLGVNLAGVEMIIRMSLRTEALEREVEMLRRRLASESEAPARENPKQKRG
ncbi:MAG: MerR family transcriptional regulator [SAR202 cluster bacterium]|nr:MerR family transcriptional regulator [SAR202 cluster bacterium]